MSLNVASEETKFVCDYIGKYRIGNYTYDGQDIYKYNKLTKILTAIHPDNINIPYKCNEEEFFLNCSDKKEKRTLLINKLSLSYNLKIVFFEDALKKWDAFEHTGKCKVVSGTKF